MIHKNRLVNFRVTDEQYHLLCQKAASEGVALSEYVRERVLPDARQESLEARVSRLEMAISPGELLAVAKGSM